MTRVFLTGGSGLIGGALAARLVERGDEVTALARSDAGAAKLEALGARTVRGDVLDEAALRSGMEGCELVYHVAGVNALCTPDPAGMLRVNIEGAKLAVRAAAEAGARRVVLTSSAAAIGEAKGTVGSESSPHRGSYMSVYERSKHQGEIAALAEAKRSGIEIVAINPSSVQGPGRAHGTGKILIAYLNGKLKAFIDTRISIVDIDDCIEAHLLGADRGADGERYLINSATMTSLQALELVTKISGVKHDVRLVPPVLARGVAVAVEGVFRVRRKTAPVCREMITTMLHGHHYDGSRAAAELGLAYTPAEDTFRRTIEWARSKGLVSG